MLMKLQNECGHLRSRATLRSMTFTSLLKDIIQFVLTKVRSQVKHVTVNMPDFGTV